MEGDSNSKCTSLSFNDMKYRRRLQYDVSKACSSDNNCVFYESCVAGQCIQNMKQCPNKCSNQGVCQYFDANNQETFNCTAINPFCTAACKCRSGAYGSDCSLSFSIYNSTSLLRNKLCSSVYSTVLVQDVSSDVVKSRMSSISDILQDVTQISDLALFQCTYTLIATIEADPVLAGQLDLATYSVKALNNVSYFVCHAANN